MTKYLKTKNRISYKGDREMPKIIKDLAQFYKTLDLNDLAYLRFSKRKDKYAQQALSYALDIKDLDTERIKQEFEGRYMGKDISNVNLLLTDFANMNCIYEEE